MVSKLRLLFLLWVACQDKVVLSGYTDIAIGSYKGGAGGVNAGGGGADSTQNTDDGAGGGEGVVISLAVEEGVRALHGTGEDGGKGGSGGNMGTYAGGGGSSNCPAGNGGDGGNAGSWALNEAKPPRQPSCRDTTKTGGNAGSARLGGGGGDSCGSNLGGGGGGGGLQFGNSDFLSRLSYGGGGGGVEVVNLVTTPTEEGEEEMEEAWSTRPVLNKKAQRSAPGGSGAGGSVVIFTNKLYGDPTGKIAVAGGSLVKCAFGAGGGGGGGIGRYVIVQYKVTHQSN
ncbi:hypothetical protein OS493_033917 [Desmophyllum pertusum]|uniref:PE-PGRS family protein n=1 Tax=Desmophyllum pertusum TaxID=174260 RepID=A0A9W9ZWA6_9CNID|nr:hypothetical protein OS493_033917 [Desmophyllum pertusum]